jgi:UPF0716 protein FxsA
MLKLLFLFTVVPTIELYVLLKIGATIGGGETILLVIITGILGARMAHREGLSVIRQIQEDAVNGVPPADKLVEGLMVLMGGILLVTPGVMTDFFGLSLIFPLTRRLMATRAKGLLKERMHFEGVHVGAPRPGPAATAAADVFSDPTPSAPPSDSDNPFDHPVR